MFRRIARTVRRTAYYFTKKISDFVTGTARHAESITVLSFSAIGMNAMMGELPFVYALPVWIEAAMVIPVLSVIAVSLLVKSAEVRTRRRLAY